MMLLAKNEDLTKMVLDFIKSRSETQHFLYFSIKKKKHPVDLFDTVGKDGVGKGRVFSLNLPVSSPPHHLRIESTED